MKTRVNGVYLLSLIVFVFLVSCDDSRDESLEDSLCNPSSDYYFSGILDDQLECWNAGEYNYQVYRGWGSTVYAAGDTTHYWQPGLDQYPVPDINKTIFLHLEVPYNIQDCSSEEFHNTFKIGSYNFSPIDGSSVDGIEILYSVNKVYYSTRYGSQAESYINCIEVSEAAMFGNVEGLNITWEFRCKLYAPDGSFYKEIKIGKLRSSAVRHDSE